MKIELKQGEGLGWGTDDEFFTPSDATCIEELIDDAKSSGLFDDETYVHVFLTYPLNVRGLLKRGLQRYEDALDELIYDMGAVVTDYCKITADDELLDMLERKVELPVTHNGKCIGIYNLEKNIFNWRVEI